MMDHSITKKRTVINNENKMKALFFEKKIFKLIKAYIRGKFDISGYWKEGGPISLKTILKPKILNEEYVIVKTVFCGICGSDIKEITLSGAIDNPIQSFISFPHLMGHEPVGIIEEVGKEVKDLRVGDRIIISPWFSCETRDIKPICPRCKAGDLTHCHNFNKGILPKGMHLGVVKGIGGFADYIPVHKSQCFKLPDEISFEEGVLADPFSVAFHACLLLNPKPTDKILVYGLGIIGLLTIICLKNLFKIENIYAVGKYEFQAKKAIELGTQKVFMSQGSDLIEEIGSYFKLELYTPNNSLKWAIDGLDGIIDNIAAASTLEVGMRILKSQAKLVFPGVNTPQRIESTPHYFKELEIIGSNAFSYEIYENEKKHAFEFFIEFLSKNKINLTGLVTHEFRLSNYKSAFNTLTNKIETEAIKVLFRF